MTAAATAAATLTQSAWLTLGLNEVNRYKALNDAHSWV